MLNRHSSSGLVRPGNARRGRGRGRCGVAGVRLRVPETVRRRSGKDSFPIFSTLYPSVERFCEPGGCISCRAGNFISFSWPGAPGPAMKGSFQGHARAKGACRTHCSSIRVWTMRGRRCGDDRARRLEGSPFGRLEGRQGGEAVHAGSRREEEGCWVKSVCKGMEKSLPRFSGFFKAGGAGLFFIRCEWEAAEADAFREMFPHGGRMLFPPCVSVFLRLIILPLSCGGSQEK